MGSLLTGDSRFDICFCGSKLSQVGRQGGREAGMQAGKERGLAGWTDRRVEGGGGRVGRRGM